MSKLFVSAAAHGVSTRVAVLVGTALGSTLAPAIASAQNISASGSDDYTLVETGTRAGGPRTVDITTSGGNILLDLGTVVVENSTGTQGAGIAANNTGPGIVGIAAANVTATGTGLTYAIDARATTGAITITNTGAVNTSGNNADRAIYAASAGGDITITSNEANGQQRGISTNANPAGAGTFGTTGTTTINSTTATANGTGVVNAILGQGARVVINSGTATNSNASGNQGTAILANAGAGGATVVAGTTNAFGQNQAALQVFSDGSVDVTSGAIRTTQNSDGLSIQTGTDIVVRSTSITTEGTGGARGIVIGGASGGGSLNGGPNGIVYNSATVTSGTISTVGNAAYGIYVTPTSGTTTINTGAITTTGANATGVFVTPIGTGVLSGATTISNTGRLETTGLNASGVRVNAGTGPVAISNTGQVVTTGQNSYGINVVPASGATTITGTGSITTSGQSAHGIYFNPAANTNTGAISVTAGPIAVSGSDAIGIYAINAGGSVAITASDVRAAGTNGTAILVQPTSGSTAPVDVTAGIVRATGNGAAINLSSNGFTGPITASVLDSLSVGSAIDARSVGAVTLTGGTVQTTGANATGLVAISTGGTATVNSTNLTSANRGIYAQGLDNVTVVTGTLVSANADFGLIARTSAAANNDAVVGTAEGVVNVTSGTLTATNVGINAYGPRATINVDSGTVNTTAGTGIQAFGIDVNVTSGTINTGVIGIEAGMGTGATRRGATVVNSGTINVNGTVAGATTGAIVANGASVVVNSGTITSTGVGNRFGISAQVPTSTVAGGAVTGTLSVNSGSITAVGEGAYGIQAITDAGALMVVSTGTISTSGSTRFVNTGTAMQPRYSAGIIAYSPAGAITIDSNAITTLGAQSDGIRVEAGSGNTGTFNASPNNAAAPISVTTRGTTQTAGANAIGVNVFGGGGAVTIANTGTIATTGQNAHAIQVTPQGGATSITSNIVTASGAFAHGIAVMGGTGPVTIDAADTRVGTGTAILVQPASGSTGAITVNAGIVRSDASSAAINLSSNGIAGPITVGVADSISVGSAVDARSAGNVAVTSGVVQTTGTATALIANSFQGTVAVSSDTLSSGGNGINAYAPRASASVQSGSVTAIGTGIQAYGIDTSVVSGSVSSTAIGIDSGFADVSPQLGSTTVTSGSIAINGTTTATTNAIVAANRSITIVSDSIVATGTGNRLGITAQAIGGLQAPGDITITSGSITTAGNAAGIQALASNGAVDITSTGSITTTGTTRAVAPNQDRFGSGIIGVSQTGSVTIRSNDISTAGAGSSGIRVEQGSGITNYSYSFPAVAAAVTVTSTGTVQTGGADAAGILIQGGGGAATVLNSGTIATTGAGAFGMTLGGAGDVSIASNIVGTTGAGATGLRIVGAAGAVDLTATTTTTTGAGANAIQAQAGGAIGIVAGTATAAAGTGIAIDAGGAATVEASLVRGSGDGQAGVRVTGNGGVTLTVAAASSTGASVIDAQSGQLARADAIFAEAVTGAITASVGSASAQGAGADGVHLLANGTGGAVTLAVTGTVTSALGTGVFIDPPGAVQVAVGAGARVTGAVNGVNTTGGSNAIVNAGTIGSTGAAAIVAAGATVLDNSGTIAGAGGVAVQLGASNDTVILRTGSAVTGAIQGGGGTDAARLIGSGTTASAAQTVATLRDFATLAVESGVWTAPATAAGAGSTIGATTIAGGARLALTGGADGFAGFQTATIANDGELTVTTAGNVTSTLLAATTVSGTGGVRFTGGGTAALAGTNTLANTGTNIVDAGATVLVTGTQGGNFVNNGVFQIGSGGTTGAFTGNLIDNGTLIVDRSDTYTFAGALSGAGTFIKNGAGQVVFGANYAFTGTTVLNGGSIRLAAPVAANTELDVRGTGTIDLSGQNNRIAELAGNSATASVNIAGGSLTVAQSTNTSFAGNLTGNGALIKSGTGTLNLTGTNSYTGPTTINGGRLAVNGSIASPVTVVSGGTLGGTGTINGNVTIASGGTYDPGNSIGTQTVNGNLTFAAGSTFLVEANAAGQSDRIIATGTATINGGTVAVMPLAGSYAQLTSYNIITANGGVTGRFANVTSSMAFLTPLLSYGATTVGLTLARNDTSFASLAAGSNQAAVAVAIAGRPLGDAVFNAILVQPFATAAAAFDQLAGELHGTVPSVLVDGGRRVRELVLNRAAIEQDGVGVWLDGVQAFARSRNQFGFGQARSNRTGLYGGVDYGTGLLSFGVNGGYLDQDIAVRGRASSAEVDTKLIGASVAYRPAGGGLTVLAGVTRAWHDYDTTRTVSVTGLGGTLVGAGDARSTELFGEVGYALVGGPVTVAPFVRYAHDRIRADALTETGGSAALTLGRDSRSANFLTLGTRFGGSAPLGEGLQLQPKGTLSFERAWGDLRDGRTAGFAAGTGPAFTVTGVQIGRDTFGGDLGADLVWNGGLRIGAAAFGSRSKQWNDYGAKLTVGFRF